MGGRAVIINKLPRVQLLLSVICPEALGFTDISSLNEIQVTLQDTPTSSRLASLEDRCAKDTRDMHTFHLFW